MQNLPGSIRAVHGHFWFGKYVRYFPAAEKIVWLREPARRIISAYHYWKAAPRSASHPLHQLLHDENLSLLEFARLPGGQNSVIEMYLRGYGLDDFDFVGIQEHFSEDLQALSALMAWPAIDPPVLNKTEHSDYRQFSFNDATIAELRALNAADTELYEQALRRRAARTSLSVQ